MSRESQRLSGRERQILDALFGLERARLPEIRARMELPPSANAVRTLLQILEEKGHVKRERVGRENLYRPAQSRKRAGLRALRHVLQTFYDGSMEEAVAAHFTGTRKADREEVERLQKLIDEIGEDAQ